MIFQLLCKKKKIGHRTEEKMSFGIVAKAKGKKVGKKGTHRDMMSFKPNKEEKKI